ncbi:MAG TPA: response regulator [Candidatus Methylomirabilis sp.]|nr:response regulator [Candidatus Methylomirabilis sp.]
MAKILVADDSRVVQRVAHHLLSTWGFEVAVVANGEEAMTWLSNDRPDLIISDVNMPGRTGYDICNFVRSNATLAETPLLLISGVVNDEVTRQAEACRADGVIKKPFDETGLKSRILDLLARSASRPTSQVATPPKVESKAPPSAPAETRSGPTGPPKPASQAPERLSQRVQAPKAEAASSAPTGGASGKISRITGDALQAVQQTVAGMKKLEAALAEERAQSARLTQELALARQDSERVRELESLLAQEQAKSAQLSRRLEDVERDLAEAIARADAMTQTISEITRLVGPS